MADTPYVSAGPWPVPQVLTVPEVPMAVVEFTEDDSGGDLTKHFDRALAQLVPCIVQHRITPSAAVTAYFSRMSGEHPPRTDGYVGFPVAYPLAEDIDAGEMAIVAAGLPAGEVMALTYLGGYDGLAGAWQTLLAAVDEAGRQAQGPGWEVYVTEPGPDGDPAVLRTDLYCLLS